MPHVRPTSHHRGQPDRGWTPHRRHGNGSRPMHMDWTACLLESSTMMRPAVRSVHEAGEIRRGSQRRLSTITPIHEPWQEEPRFTVSPNRDIDANDPFERNGAVIAHRYRATPRIGGGPVSSVPVDFDGKTAFIKTHIPSRAVGSSGGTFQSHSYLIAYFTAHIVLISSQNVAIMRQNNTEVHSNYS